MKCITPLIILGVAGCFLSCSGKKASKPPENVLLIIVDDLRPELRCYGNDLICSPNIDRLAQQGVRFVNAFCNVPVCGASRASFLTGLRPTPSRFLDFDTYAEKDAPGFTTLPGYFKDHGYTTVSNGKVFHHGDDHEEVWDRNWRPSDLLDYKLPENQNPVDAERGRPFEAIEADDSIYNDGKIASRTVDDLRALKEAGKPFFLAVGFLKPHLPFNAPRKYWDLYEGKITLPYNNFVPHNAPKRSIHNWGELRRYAGVPAEGPVSDSLARRLIQGYNACVSYVDAQIGRVLRALEDLGLDSTTNIVLIGDHGYNLLEHTLWCKHCNYRTSLRSVMIIKSPHARPGGVSHVIAEFVDIFPTLAELTGLGGPDQLQGISLAPELSNPSTKANGLAISGFTKGYTITTPDYGFTEWIDDSLGTDTEMLYDHRNDLDENTNVASDPEYGSVVDSLRRMLRDNWGFGAPSGM